jgi:E3 Ubiquitin ligase
VLSDFTSSEPFLVKDKSGTVVVTVDDADIDEAPKTFDRMEKDKDTDLGDGVLASVAEAFANWNDDTIGIQREEWSLRPGQRLFVHGEVNDKAGRLEFGKADGHPYLISTRTRRRCASRPSAGARSGRTRRSRRS